MEAIELKKLWSELCEEASSSQKPLSRVYRALGKTAVGVRASFVPAEQTYELLVEIPTHWEKGRTLPEWRGLQLKVLTESFLPHETFQLSFTLVDNDAKGIFLHFTADMVTSLEGISDPSNRIELVVECLERWNSFFERCTPIGLSDTAQRGLLGELIFLERLIDMGTEPKAIVNSWKGCQRSYYDFDLLGNVVEVKSTVSKEPRRVWINNERQLDNRKLKSLHLFVTTFQVTEGGRSLPEMVGSLRQKLEYHVSARMQFEKCLVSAGYLDSHESSYSNGYVLKAEELFSVRENFPRIVDIPSGVGDIRYCVVLSACQEFKVNLEEFLKQLQENMNA